MAATTDRRTVVLVVGAGPVGLYLGARLAAAGLESLVIDRRGERSGSSRAIGVHPPGLRALDRVGVGDALRSAGVRVRRARAWGAAGPLATLDLEPAGEVLSVPQQRTETLLEERLVALAGAGPLREHELLGLRQDATGVEASLRTPSGEQRWRAELLVGCDGRASTVRRALGIGGSGGRYRDGYVMADLRHGAAVADPLGEDALVHLHAAGVVESFPLPGARRWVAHVGAGSTSGATGDPLDALRRAVESRTPHAFAPSTGTQAAVFGIERFLVDRFRLGRVALAGDAAHVVSPIGGQGMNLGWLDAEALVRALERWDGRGAPPEAELERYAADRRERAHTAIRRAAWNTRLGRPTPRALGLLRDAALRRALRPPFVDALRGAFTMRGLE